MKRDPSVAVTATDYWNAFNGYHAYYSMKLSAPPQTFANFLGMAGDPPIRGTIMIRQSAVRKVQMLNSPHWYALMKAHELRKRS